jgi:hypothetical protein
MTRRKGNVQTKTRQSENLIYKGKIKAKHAKIKAKQVPVCE